MKNVFLFSLLCIISNTALCQKQVKEYVQQQIVSLKSIDPATADFSDLSPIGAAIGESRIVMIGEQDHGDGATMLAKSRLIKYLHEEKGFNVLAFEGDFFALNEGWDQLPKEEEQIKQFLKENIFPIWADCEQCGDLLYSYIPATYQTPSPLQVTGFDNQVGSFEFSKGQIKKSIDQYLQHKKVKYTESMRYQRFLYYLNMIGAPVSPSLKGEFQEGMKWFVQSADSVLEQLGPDASRDLEYLTLESLREFAKARLHSGDYVQSYNYRDRQMAKNLQWLARTKYPEEKIIVWAANGHIMKNADTAIKGKRDASISWMGTAFTKDSLNASQTYVLGFSSLQGTYKRTTERQVKAVPRPLKQGFETWIDERIAYGFVDFKPFRLLYPRYNKMFMMKPRQFNMTGNWTSVFDGIFYIRDMVPCETLGAKEKL